MPASLFKATKLCLVCFHAPLQIAHQTQCGLNFEIRPHFRNSDNLQMFSYHLFLFTLANSQVNFVPNVLFILYKVKPCISIVNIKTGGEENAEGLERV